MSVKPRRLFLAIAVLAIVGAAISSVSLYHHYGTGTSTFCDFGQSFNCDMVNRSVYSTVMGIPVALIGVMGYLALAGLAAFRRETAETPAMLVIGSLAGLGLALYLTYIEAFVLGVWCLLCLSSLAVIFTMTAVAGFLLWQTKRV